MPPAWTLLINAGILPTLHDLHQRITSLHILDKSPCSDHLPIHAVFNLDVIGTIDPREGSESKNCSTVPAIDQRSKATDVDIDNYFRGTHMLSQTPFTVLMWIVNMLVTFVILILIMTIFVVV